MWRPALLSLCILLSGCGWGWSISTGSEKDQRTPIEKSAQEGDAAEVERLLASGTDANDRHGIFGSPLQAACFRKGNGRIVRVLISAGADPNGRASEHGRCWVTPLAGAAGSGDVEMTTTLLDAGASIEQPDCSKLNVAWLERPIIEVLAARGLNVHTVDVNGRNQLHLALAPPGLPVFSAIEYLLGHGVPVNARDKAGKTPLAYWRKPRDYEQHWFRNWLMERLSSDPFVKHQRELRDQISALLSQSGATM